MITRNKRMGPRNSFLIHHRSTTSKNKMEFIRTNGGVEHSNKKTTETYTIGDRTKDCNDLGGIRRVTLGKIAEQ